MGNSQSSPLETCLNAVCGDRADCVAYPDTILYQVAWVKPYNLDDPVTPAAVVRPDNAQDVSGIVKCAVENGFHVQAKSGGHSYANFGLGGEDGAVAIDLVNMKDFSMDEEMWYATIGAGFRLGEIDEQLHEHGGRATAHGVCPGVGIGGHATIGGIGPMSRMWGTLLDHVVDVEVVTADGSIQRANETHNADLFWALRGAGSSFGVVTEFVVRTHPEPADVVQYSYGFSFGSQSDMAPVFAAWQDLVYDEELDERFSTLFIAEPLGALVTGTFYGTQEEFEATGILGGLPSGGVASLNVTDWLGHLAHEAEVEALYLSDVATQFYSKSLAFRAEDKMGVQDIASLFAYMDEADKGTLAWFVIWDSEGGAINEVAAGSTAYPHRDKVAMYQSYMVGIPALSDATVAFAEGIDGRVRAGAGTGTANTTYAGYVDPLLGHDEAVGMYWGSNVPRLREVKRAWDGGDVFHNPQSIEPAEGEGTGEETGE